MITSLNSERPCTRADPSKGVDRDLTSLRVPGQHYEASHVDFDRTIFASVDAEVSSSARLVTRTM